MLFDFLVIFFIIAFSYAFTFKEDIPKTVTNRALLLMLCLLVLFNITSIVGYLSLVIERMFQ